MRLIIYAYKIHMSPCCICVCESRTEKFHLPEEGSTCALVIRLNICLLVLYRLLYDFPNRLEFSYVAFKSVTIGNISDHLKLYRI